MSKMLEHDNLPLGLTASLRMPSLKLVYVVVQLHVEVCGFSSTSTPVRSLPSLSEFTKSRQEVPLSMRDVSLASKVKITLVGVENLHCAVQKLLFSVLWLGTSLKNLGTNLSS